MHEEVQYVLRDSPVLKGQYRGDANERIKARFDLLKREQQAKDDAGQH